MIDLRGLSYTDADGFSWVEIDLTYAQFMNIEFSDRLMQHETHEYLLRFPYKKISKIAERMIRDYPGVDAVEVFRNTQADVQSSWFKTFVKLCDGFTKHKMDRQRIWLWAELLEDNVNFAREPLRIRGGHHRCLVYAVKLLMGDLSFRPVRTLLQVRGRNWRLVE